MRFAGERRLCRPEKQRDGAEGASETELERGKRNAGVKYACRVKR